MAPSRLLIVPAGDGDTEQVSVGPDGVQADVAIVTSHEASVGAGLSGGERGAVEETFPLGIVIVALVLIVAGATAMVLGFRSARRESDEFEHHDGQHLRVEARNLS